MGSEVRYTEERKQSFVVIIYYSSFKC